ncbi:16S rRNA (cytidine(1402)-2'-O)-methyltransferase, partial [Thiolapillus sp.]
MTRLGIDCCGRFGRGGSTARQQQHAGKEKRYGVSIAHRPFAQIKEAAEYRMSEPEVSNSQGTLYIVSTPIGNLDDMSQRAIRVLRQVDRIAAEDTRHSRRLLQQHGIDTPMMALHEHNERKALKKVLEMLAEGKSLALISDAGTPLISDPGFPLVRACREQGIRVSPVPGPSALIAALSVSGLPVDAFCFHGFLPRTSAARKQRLAEWKATAVTQVFYESSHRILYALQDMQEVLGGEREVCVARELTKQYEEIIQGNLSEVVESVGADSMRQRGEFVVVLAPSPMENEDELSVE